MASERGRIGAILGCVSQLERHTATALAALLLVVAGCGGDAEKAGSAAVPSDELAALVLEFERAVTETRLLRDDIAAVREDMRAVREAADGEAARAYNEAARLRGEMTALRLEVQELSAGASSQAERTAEEARSLREEVKAIRDELSAMRDAAEETASLSPEEIAGSPGQPQIYPEAVLIDDAAADKRNPYRNGIYQPRTVIYAPRYAQRPFTPRPRTFRDDGRRRPGRRSSEPAAQPSEPVSRPSTPATRPSTPVARPSAPAISSAPRAPAISVKGVHTPTPER